MLNILADRRSRDCDGSTRRDFLKVGTLSAAGVSLPALLAARARAGKSGQAVKDTSVVWLWLGGGPTHVETFDPKMTAPSEFRSVTGEVSSVLPGLTLGGTFPEIAKVADKMAFIRSFAHRNSGHGGGTHWVMTGYDNRMVDNGGRVSHPSLGSITARVRGTNHSDTGMPTYVRMNGILADGPAYLGAACAPFDPQGQARKNMTLATKAERLSDRRELLESLDRFKHDADATGLMDGLDEFEDQAFNLILGDATAAFDLSKEDPRLIAKYGTGRNRGNAIGEQMLIARRLCEAGCAFVTINYGGWDMHAQIKRGLENRAPAVDRAVAAFVEDITQRGLSEKILLVITGEFGRTPRINRTAGRDHWAPLSTLALAGGGLKMGQVIGESNANAEVPKSSPISPQDLMATVFEVLGIPPKLQFTNLSGRPVYLVEDGQPIRE